MPDWSFIFSLIASLACIADSVDGAELSDLERLGKAIFFDTNLSVPAGQACASCHAPEAGFTGPVSDINTQTAVYPGAVSGRFGNRKPPTVAYTSFSPKRTYNKDDETWVGGQFYDGRADDLIQQAKGPFLNPLEMNNSSPEDVVNKVQSASYSGLFEKVFGRQSLDGTSSESAFNQIAQAIAAYESSREVNSFQSKYDAYLAGRAKLTPQQERGLNLFAGKANCSACHPHQASNDGTPPLFTDFTYDNLGAPRNEANPYYRAAKSVNPDGNDFRDLGLGKVVDDDAHNGKFKVPTLRNVAKKPSPDFVKSYLHNGAFKSLKEVIHFYNKAGQEIDQFPPAEYPDTVNREELGNLGLTDADEDDLVAFLETLSDQPISTDVPIPAQPSAKRDPFRPAREAQRVEQFRQRVIQASGQSESLRR